MQILFIYLIGILVAFITAAIYNDRYTEDKYDSSKIFNHHKAPVWWVVFSWGIFIVLLGQLFIYWCSNLQYNFYKPSFKKSVIIEEKVKANSYSKRYIENINNIPETSKEAIDLVNFIINSGYSEIYSMENILYKSGIIEIMINEFNNIFNIVVVKKYSGTDPNPCIKYISNDECAEYYITRDDWDSIVSNYLKTSK